MDNLLSDITLFTTFICLGMSLWFAIYLLARSRANPLAIRAIVALAALAFYYTYLVNALVNEINEKSPVRSFAIMIALIAWHDLTLTMLNPVQYRRRYMLGRGLLLIGLIVIAIVFTAPPALRCDPIFICPIEMNTQNLVFEIYNGMIFCSIVFNLWSIRKTEGRRYNLAFFIAILVGVGSITFSFIGNVLNTPVPRLLPNLLIFSAINLMAYSVARNRTFITHRTLAYDLPVSLLTIVVIVGIYYLTGKELRLSGSDLVLIIVLAVFTHSAYDFVRDFLEQLFRRQQRQMRRELDELGREASSQESLQRYLSRGLAILCNNINAASGFIAIRQNEQYTVVASCNSLPNHTQFPIREATLESVAPPDSKFFSQIAWLAPGYAGSEQVVVVGIGTRKDFSPYNEEDLFWLEDIAHEIGQIVHIKLSSRTTTPAGDAREISTIRSEDIQPIDQGGLLTALVYKPDQELVAHIEDGYQHLNDYGKLGRSPLVGLFGIQAADHLESGKLVHYKLIELLDKLKPEGEPPPEPLPRAWYAYTILHDSYVNDQLSRDIMGKLYIGEGTYYRLRRQALRGITRAVLEMGAA